MNTFTTDTWYGKSNPVTNELEEKTRKALSKVAEQFIRDCIANDIAVCSADGLFHSLVFQELTTARLKVVDEVRKETFKEGTTVYFIDHYDINVIEAVITEQKGGRVTVKGLNMDYIDKYIDKNMADLFLSKDQAEQVIAAKLNRS